MCCRNNSLRLAFNASLWNPSLSDWLHAGKCIQVEERKRISEFHYKNDAKLSLAGRLLLRYAITLCTGIKWQTLRLIRDKKAKPLLDPMHDSSLYFNASHQGDYVVVVADDVMIGVDVMDTREKHGDQEKFFDLMNRQFTDDEWKEIKLLNDPVSQMKSFYRHWCLKESYVKAIGEGIGYSLLSLNFVTNSAVVTDAVVTDTKLFNNNLLAQDWTFEESVIGVDHVVAVAKNAVSNFTPSFIEINFSDVMSVGQPLTSDFSIDQSFTECYHNPYKLKNL